MRNKILSQALSMESAGAAEVGENASLETGNFENWWSRLENPVETM